MFHTTTPPSNTGSLRRSGRNLLKLLSGKAVNVPLGLLQISLTTHLLGDKGYGFLILIHSFSQTIGDLAEFQSWQTVLHYGFKSYKNKDIPLLQRVLRFSFFLDICSGVFALIVGLLCAIYCSSYLGWPAEWRYLGIFYSCSVIFTTSATSNGILRLLNRYDLIAIQGTVANFIRVLGMVCLILIGGGLADAVGIWMLAAIINLTTFLAFALYQLHLHGLLKNFLKGINHGLTKDLPGIWRFAWNTNLNMTFSLAFKQVTTLVIGGILGPIAAGYYNIANKIAEAMAKPIVLLQSTLYPEMVRSWQSNKPSHLYKMASQITISAGVFTSLVLLVLPYIAVPIMHLLLHKDPPPETLTLLYWLAGAELILTWGMSLEPILITTGNTSGAIYAKGIDVLIFLPMLYVSIHYWELGGIGPATVIAAFILIILQAFFMLIRKNKNAAI
ncbi:Membrane protein involved in the export of O-antigen and teichoic acid (RfbX) [Commensalibacter communis]|uniref:Membrane protein involved in the export of O-antigen and teichoic acid (RfbX) n=1 Tax=Commensalibacter communis TaxID=2972786 RepID=A0A9W4TMD4_9PROT|nr:lipopolysaccharide biosynthesis protein [Commensalibacter communis]CAI3940006.1 Membrane protein involved in the export of O-antigen and teichoic acid (RfbX) [Commensalibacter communis]CAI3940333.1 Membrane protein involved in the export of O-antigen and teichoic acid (RfbX) [Commensalibacter communis]CAI3943152.1 Membrane protein involved in the export of O-antigen and teichoic acid (RfbX) [Commensalibacter communis]CAI3946624.1 Membrane protein involved in the export of O-antigen and teich